MKLCAQKQLHVFVICPARFPTGKYSVHSFFPPELQKGIAQKGSCCPLSNFLLCLPFTLFPELFSLGHLQIQYFFFFLMWSIFAWILVETHWHKKLSIMIKTIPLFTCFMSVNLHVPSGYKAEYIQHHSPLFTNEIISRLILLYIWQKGDLLP